MLGLARGMGRRVALSQDYERKLINEHDIAVYSFGNFSDCIMNKKPKLFSGVDVPIVATGGPDLSTDDVEGADVYVGGIGRVSHRLRNEGEIDSLDVLNKTVGEVVDKLREEISRDPLAVLPARVMKEIKEQVPEINDVLTPAPITLQLDGMRVKLPFDQFHEKLKQLDLDEDVSLSDVANIMPSKMKDYILIKIRRRSETGFTI
jgi:putative methanogenesis marker protein 7